MKTSFIRQKVKETLRGNWLGILLAIILVLLLLLADVIPCMIIVYPPFPIWPI